jgi:hypothetical protein
MKAISKNRKLLLTATANNSSAKTTPPPRRIKRRLPVSPRTPRTGSIKLAMIDGRLRSNPIC